MPPGTTADPSDEGKDEKRPIFRDPNYQVCVLKWTLSFL